jgi:hypothetical protein
LAIRSALPEIAKIGCVGTHSSEEEERIVDSIPGGLKSSTKMRHGTFKTSELAHIVDKNILSASGNTINLVSRLLYLHTASYRHFASLPAPHRYLRCLLGMVLDATQVVLS